MVVAKVAACICDLTSPYAEGCEAKRPRGYFEESTRSIRLSASDKDSAISAQNGNTHIHVPVCARD